MTLKQGFNDYIKPILRKFAHFGISVPEDFDIMKHFNKVFASADYGVRKSGKKFFDIAVEKILEDLERE